MSARPGADVPSLTQRIRTDIEQKIMSGVWKPGDRIPVEHVLAAQYGCARMTVTRATEALAEAGLIVRRKRVGSFVAKPRLESAILDIPDIQANVAARGKVYGLHLLDRHRRRPSSGDESRHWTGEGELLQLDCLHLADGEPFALEQRLINLAVVPEAADVDFSAISPGSWLLGHVPWTEAEHRISARAADGPTADIMKIDRGASCLVLERQTWRGEAHVTWVRQIFPGDSYDLVARFTPKADGRN
jgi:GntR family transcriptional regulator, histidine utilization repressor